MPAYYIAGRPARGSICRKRFENIKAEISNSIQHDNRMDKQDSGDLKQGTADMNAFVQNLLQQMQVRFQLMSENIVSKIDEMGNRINDLEESINDLRTEMGAEGSPSPLASKQKPDEAKPDESPPA